MTEIFKADKKYIIESEEFICSLECIKQWMYRNNHVVTSELATAKRNNYRYIYPFTSDSIAYRSEYERKFAFFLSKILHYSFGYEMFGFDLSTGTYTPDFWVSDHNVCIEIKGIIGIGFRKKLERFRKEYSQIKLLLVPWIIKDHFYKLPLNGVIK